MAKKKSPLAWLGGKSKLATQIIERMPVHTAYVEVFAGAAWVLFSKEPSKVEIINDINSELVNFYRVVKHHRPAFIEQLDGQLIARDEFRRFLCTPADVLTDIQRAARFYYVSKMSFGARVYSPSFGVAATGAPRLNLTTLDADIASAEARLKRVFVENLPYETVLTRFDKSGTLFYIDPPYWGCEGDYGRNIFGRDDFSKLASLLASLKGKFILSLNDVPGVRSTFGSFKIESVKTTYSASAKGVTAANEVLITNF
jgi:DNA adenine methylase